MKNLNLFEIGGNTVFVSLSDYFDSIIIFAFSLTLWHWFWFFRVYWEYF